MKKKKAIGIIKKNFRPYMYGALIKIGKNNYDWVLGKDNVVSCLAENIKIKRLYSFIGCPKKVRMTKM